MSDRDSDSDIGILDDLPFEGVNERTIVLTYFEGPDHLNGLATRRTYRRDDFEENTLPRYTFDVEMYVFLRFYVRTYILSLLRTCTTRIMFWISAG